MKKLFASALILTTLSSLGTMCFASTWLSNSINAKTYTPCGLKDSQYFIKVINILTSLIEKENTLLLIEYIREYRANINELFHLAFVLDTEAYTRANNNLRWFSRAESEDKTNSCDYAKALCDDIREAMCVINKVNPTY